MEQPTIVSLNYSTKNIPIPQPNVFKKRLIEKVESVIKRMRWKALFFLKATKYRNCNDKDENTPTPPNEEKVWF